MAERDAQTETQSIETASTVMAVLDVLADPRRIPQWAPGFADHVSEHPDSGWLATKDGREFQLRVAVTRDAGTVDILREVAPGRELGAYIRAIPRPRAGAVIIMTLPLLANTDPSDTRSILSQELTALVSLVDNV